MILLFVILSFANNTASGPPLYFFYRPSCGHCMDILLGDIPKLEAGYDFQLKKYDIDLISNYQLLEKMEHEHGRSGEELPVIFISDSVFYGPENIYEKLKGVLSKYLKETQPAPLIEPSVKDTTPAVSSRVALHYFFQPGCDECRRLDALFYNLMKNDSISIIKHSILEDTSKILLEAMSERIQMPVEKRLLVPVVIIDKGYLIKQDITTDNIFNLIEKPGNDSENLNQFSSQDAEKNIKTRFERFSFLGIIFAGLLDGVNPCAFATIVFFVSYLLFLGRRRRDIIMMSVSFVGAVFLAYFLIGLGAYKILNFLAEYEIIAKVIFLCFGVIALILGALSLRDFFYARKGRRDKMILQLPLGIKQKIHRDIKERTAVGGIVLGSFIAGLVVSFLEFGCTGQIYLPTITFMVSRTGLSIKPTLSLLVYNVMFVLPLILISVLAIGVSTQKIASTLSSRIPMIKLFTAILFFVLGVLLILSA